MLGVCIHVPGLALPAERLWPGSPGAAQAAGAEAPSAANPPPFQSARPYLPLAVFPRACFMGLSHLPQAPAPPVRLELLLPVAPSVCSLAQPPFLCSSGLSVSPRRASPLPSALDPGRPPWPWESPPQLDAAGVVQPAHVHGQCSPGPGAHGMRITADSCRARGEVLLEDDTRASPGAGQPLINHRPPRPRAERQAFLLHVWRGGKASGGEGITRPLGRPSVPGALRVGVTRCGLRWDISLGAGAGPPCPSAA